MTISVVICSYKGNEQLTQACIVSLELQKLKPDEIIVVVDTDAERTFFSEVLTSLIPMKILATGKQGLVAARNTGVINSTGDIIAFIDDDATADPDWLSTIKQSFMDNPDFIVVGGPVKPIFKGKAIDQSLNWIVGCTSENPPTRRPIGCNFVVRRQAFDIIGTFDDELGRSKSDLKSGEETELFLRIQRHLPNYIIYYNQNAIVYHHVSEKRTKLRYIVTRAFAEGGTKARTRKKYSAKVEQSYLLYYLRHLNLLVVLVVFVAGLGYARDILKNGGSSSKLV